MFRDLKLGDEAGRLAAVARYEVIDTPAEPQFDHIVELLKIIFKVPIALVSVIDDKRQWYKASAGLSISEVPRDIAFCNYTIQSDAVLSVEDTLLDYRFANHPLVVGPPHLRSYLGIPLTSPDGYNVGTICIADTSVRQFGPGDFATLRHFAGIVISQFELRQIASRDALTGTATRRAFTEAAEREMKRHVRHGQPVTLALFDLDHFKSINDTHGHGVGDAVLKSATAACEDVMRSEEQLGRIGGEEFAVLLVNTDGADALKAAERLRHAIESATIPQLPSLPFTASFGVAACHGLEEVQSWFDKADKALYKAKSQGRNRCIVA
ncbi:sensor domain-containing diguanylate cyclase [Aureimonas fodinaquatilis]|uniref:diguanylate cyclase n=1 Tax=Aureimonas fodinaquatilis TaxID=2565783 RepID=A0A5B0DXB1_9HYPH|nr:sensor domain-containing diguanylate cyclase [Aureimonas fodinaquatilis]KAA0971113.1 sensor domain-containing diguanylate cyclase [Aureimonas fodinaquatilis]